MFKLHGMDYHRTPSGTSTAPYRDVWRVGLANTAAQRHTERQTSLVKTVDLDPSHNYLFGFHPHGVLVAGGFGNFCTEASGFSKLFPGLTPYLLMLPFWFRVPFFRDYIMCGGLVSSEKASASYLLSQPGGGAAAVVAVGGAPESLEARPGALTLQLLQRKGFIKLALKHGYEVPTGTRQRPSECSQTSPEPLQAVLAARGGGAQPEEALEIRKHMR
ncbi:hypothetical protein NFI96_002567 [Prochilodus magdalenae]|nr:hypothetical protein NFI96_002567 [Prochilodus magdalenae]